MEWKWSEVGGGREGDAGMGIAFDRGTTDERPLRVVSLHLVRPSGRFPLGATSGRSRRRSFPILSSTSPTPSPPSTWPPSSPSSPLLPSTTITTTSTLPLSLWRLVLPLHPTCCSRPLLHRPLPLLLDLDRLLLLLLSRRNELRRLRVRSSRRSSRCGGGGDSSRRQDARGPLEELDLDGWSSRSSC